MIVVNMRVFTSYIGTYYEQHSSNGDFLGSMYCQSDNQLGKQVLNCSFNK